MVSIPLPRTITSIWPLPFGLLLQGIEGNFATHVPFSSSSPLLGARDISRPRREIGHSPQNNYSFMSSYNHMTKGDTVSISSHLILSDLLEEPQVVSNSFPCNSQILLSFWLFLLSFILVSMLLCFSVLILKQEKKIDKNPVFYFLSFMLTTVSVIEF